MEDNLEYIDDYFQRMLNAEEIRRFEQKIAEDPAFAKEVAFYLAAKQGLKAEAEKEKKERFKQLLSQQAPVVNIDGDRNTRRIWIYRMSAAAAVIICLFFAWYFFFPGAASSQQVADKYINDNFTDLGITMSSRLDSIQTGLRFYNDGQYDSSLKMFEAVSQRDPQDYLPKKYAGIVCLKIGNYNKALQYFRQFENDDTLYSNPSLFYQAVTLLKRNQTGDKQQAKELLQRVVKGDLDGKEFAEQWLKKL